MTDPAAWLEERGLGVADGRDFGAPGFVRWNFGCSHALLAEALSRLERAVAEIRDLSEPPAS